MNKKVVSVVITVLFMVSIFLLNTRVATAEPSYDGLIPPKGNQPIMDRETPPPPMNIEAQTHYGESKSDPPQASDTVFFRDQFPSLDEYRFRSESPILFTIPIDRVVGRTDSSGYLLNIDNLINNRVVKATTLLKLVVWDVDEENGEVDNVFVNGVYVGKLTGVNNSWSETTFEVPTYLFKFAIPICGNEIDSGYSESHLEDCNQAPIPVENEIRIDIDTESIEENWAVTVDWGSITISAARPTLFVHGKGGSNTNTQGDLKFDGYTYWDYSDSSLWFNFRGKISSAGFLTTITENRLGAETSIRDNANTIKLIIDEMKRHYGVDRINIVAHSKGGLDSRGYISDNSLNRENNVEKLITLATPHHGSYMADLAVSNPWLATLLGQEQTDALHNLTENYVNDVFNKTHEARENVKYYSVAADAAYHFLGTTYPDLGQVDCLDESLLRKAGALVSWSILNNDGRYHGDNDFLVTTHSATFEGIGKHNGSSNTKNFGVYTLNHHSIRAGVSTRGNEDNTIANLVKNAIAYDDTSPSNVSSNLEILPENVDLASNNQSTSPEIQANASGNSAQASISAVDGTIESGQMVEKEVGVDSTTQVTFSLLWNAGILAMNLIEPISNRVISPDVSDPEIQFAANIEESSLSEYWPLKTITYSITNPIQGKWKVQIFADSNLPNDSVNYIILAPQQSDLSMVLSTNQSWYRLNDKVTVSASILNNSNPVKDALVNASITAPDKSIIFLTLTDNGKSGDLKASDGIYSGQFIPTQAGFYHINGDAKGVSNSIDFQRTAVTEISISTGAAAINKPIIEEGIDLDGDGLINILRFAIPINVNKVGQYRILGTLYDSRKHELVSADLTTSFTNLGLNTVYMEFDGKIIWAKGGKGRFYLRDVRLMDLNGVDDIQADFLAFAYKTRSYRQSQFQHDPIVVMGNPVESVVDTNKNGKYDSLVFTYPVYVDEAGWYEWNARLMTPNGTEINWIRSGKKLHAGVNKVPIAFYGVMISRQPFNGPYRAKDLTITNENGSANIVEAGITSSYLHTDFENGPTLQYPENWTGLLSLNDQYVMWEDFSSQGAVAYKILLSKTPNFSRLAKSVLVAAPQTYFFLPALTRNTTYYWKVIAYSDKNGKNLIGQSPVWAFKSPNPPPAPVPLSPVLKSISPDFPIFKWRGSKTATWYLLEVSEDKNFNRVVVYEWVYQNTYYQLDYSLANGKTYYWRLIAENNRGEISPWSRIVRFMTVP